MKIKLVFFGKASILIAKIGTISRGNPNLSLGEISERIKSQRKI